MLALAVVLTGQAFGGCQGCVESKLRAAGDTCGDNDECATSLCVRGTCTTSCASDAQCSAQLCIEGHCHAKTADLDGDGLTNARERELKTSPSNADTDGDGLLDGVEAAALSAPDRNGDGVIDALQSDTADSDGDCMVDSYDKQPHRAVTGDLPSPQSFCDAGVCSGQLASVTVVCRKDKPTHARVVLGCLGCGCEADAATGFEAEETTCDALDNDCDGVTDEGMTFDGAGLGQTCVALHGICSFPAANGVAPIGKVECGFTGDPVCSVGLGGSKTLAQPELCNGTDDDCDGEVDEGYSEAGKSVGDTCGPCGAALHVCDDGSIANPPQVRCATGGGSATCGGRPFRDTFEMAHAGRPDVQASWTVGWAPKWKRLAVYGGETPVADGVRTGADLWTLEVDGGAAASWSHAVNQPPGPRAGAAFVWDGAADRLLLLGGKSGASATNEVWALGASGQWARVSGDDLKGQAAYVPATGDDQFSSAHYGAVIGDADARYLVLFSRGRPTPHITKLSGDPASRKWQKVAAPKATPGSVALTGSVACVAPRSKDGAHAIAVMQATIGETLGVYRFSVAGGKWNVKSTVTSGDIWSRQGFSCALDDSDGLHLVGGHAPGKLTTAASAHIVGALSGVPIGATGVKFGAATNVPLDMAREEAQLVWDDGAKRLLSAGGHALTSLTTPRRTLRSAPVGWKNGALKATALDRPVPSARIGHGTTFSQKRGLCIAGGLTFALPDEPGNRARMIPAEDVWCLGGSGWQLLNSSLPPFAFGAAGLDETTGAWLLASGLKLTKGMPVADISKVWRGQLIFTEVGGGSPAVTAALHSIDLSTGAVKSLNKGPGLAAMASVVDRSRRRLLTFGGFDNTKPTTEMWQLDFATLKWKQIADTWTGSASPSSARPLAGYGAMLGFSQVNDRVVLIPGAQFQLDAVTGKWGLTFQVLAPAPDETLLIDACRGDRKTLMWTINASDDPTIDPAPVPTFADLDQAEPKVALYQPHFAQPAFTPWLYDPSGDRGVLLLPPRRSYTTKDEDGAACVPAFDAKYTTTSRAINVEAGRCKAKAAIYVSSVVMQQLPEAAVLAGGDFDEKAGRAWIWGGLRDDGRPATSTWTLTQHCKAVVP